jgi:hypothetical protein
MVWNRFTSIIYCGFVLHSLVGNVESFNGTNWTEVNDLNTRADRFRMLELKHAAIIAAGGVAFPTNS